jgi:AcrR family transcriptional regulator
MNLPAGDSLRERSKAKRRAAIQRVGLRLFAERGYDATTVAEIAEAAEVAPRTVSLYFPSKVDIAMGLANEAAERMSAAFRDHPDLDYLDVVDRWLASELRVIDPVLAALYNAMLDANPALRALDSTQIAEAMRVGTAALERLTGLPPAHPMTEVVNSSVTAAVSQYLKVALQSGATPLLRQEFRAFLAAVLDAARAVAAADAG